MDPLTIAASLRELAVYLRLERDPHRARAYEGAAATVEAVHDVERRVADGTLTELPGIGASIARVVAELQQRGTVDTLERLRARWPRTVVELSQLPGVGLKRAQALCDRLAPADLDALTAMVEAGLARVVPGFGPATEAKLLAALRGRHVRREAMALIDARRVSGQLVAYLAAAPAAIAVHEAGPVRRWLEVVDELVVVVVTDAPAAIRAHVARHPLVLAVADGDDPAVTTLRMAHGGRGRVVTTAAVGLGAALIVATGSAGHVDAMRARAAAAGRALDAIAGDEAAVYAALAAPWVPPEVRDGDDELGARWDDLVTVADVRGAVHCHTTYSDGRHSIAEMAAAAAGHGLDYLTITDHSSAAFYAHGLDDDRLRAQWAEIAEVQATTPVRLLRGVEADILVDGALDVSPAAAGELEVVVASVHSRHKLDEDAMTRRLVAAMRQPGFKIWGHALGRLVLRRDGVPCRFDEVLDAIAPDAAAIELNGDPHRLDLDPVRARAAAARGIRFVLSVDAHSTRGLDDIAYAVAMARRARLRPAQVLNALPTDGFVAAVRPQR